MMRDLASAEKHRGAKRSADEEAQRSGLKLAKRSSDAKPSRSDRRDQSAAGSDRERTGQRSDEPKAGSQGGAERQSGTAGGARAASDGGEHGASSVFAQKVPRQGSSGETQTFSLRLSAVLSQAPTEFEPQQPRQAPASRSGGVAAAPADGEPQAPDDPLLKTEVAPEYEEIVRRVFDRR
jgi:hypothetical protein